jgi:hypothetical protein
MFRGNDVAYKCDSTGEVPRLPRKKRNRFATIASRYGGVVLVALTLVACVTKREPMYPSSKPFADEIGRFRSSDRANGVGTCDVLFVGSSSIAFWKTLAALVST